MIAIVAAIIITAVLMLELGAWYFVGLIGLYAATDITQRIGDRRNVQVSMAIMTAHDSDARNVSFSGQFGHCEHAAWIAKRLGWIAYPIVREKMWRHSIQLKSVAGAAPLSVLLQTLNEEKLITSIWMPHNAPTFGRRLAEQSFSEAERKG